MTTDITELAQSLKSAAEKATPGEWCSDDQYGIVADAGLNGNYYIASCSGPEHRSNKRFIALANPANIIALVEALETGNTENERMAREIISRNGEIEGLRRHITELEESHAQVIQSRDHYKRMSEEGLKQLAESRTVTVKLPPRVDTSNVPFAAHTWNCCLDEIEKRLTAAGIKWEAE